MNVKLSHFGDEHQRVERLCRVLSTAFKRYDQWSAWATVVELHDHKGMLHVTSSERPDSLLSTVLREAWEQEGGEQQSWVEFLDLSGNKWPLQNGEE
jgi:hypothetical protein